MDAVDRSEVRADQIDKVEVKDLDTTAGKFIGKARRAASKTFQRRATQ